MPTNIIQDNYEKVLTLDGEKFGISFPTEDLFNKFRLLMKVEHPYLLIPEGNFLKGENLGIVEPRSIGASFISDITYNQDGLSFSIKTDTNCLYENSNIENKSLIWDIAKISKNTVCKCYPEMRSNRYGSYPMWRPVLIPLDKNGRRDSHNAEPSGIITEGLTMYYEEPYTRRIIPIEPYELYHEDIPRDRMLVGETHPDPKYHMKWMWVDGVLVSLYAQGTDTIEAYAKWGCLFSKFLLEE